MTSSKGPGGRGPAERGTTDDAPAGPGRDVARGSADDAPAAEVDPVARGSADDAPAAEVGPVARNRTTPRRHVPGRAPTGWHVTRQWIAITAAIVLVASAVLVVVLLTGR